MLNLFLCGSLLFAPINCNCEEYVEQNETVEINEVIVDNDNIKVTALDVTKTNSHDKGQRIKLKLDIENKTEQNIVADAKLVSFDDRIVDESMIILWGEVASGRTGTVELEVFEADGYDFPTLNDNIEFTLYLFSWKDINFEEEIPVKINLK